MEWWALRRGRGGVRPLRGGLERLRGYNPHEHWVFLRSDRLQSGYKTGRQLHLSAAVLDNYATAFEHPLMTEAGRVLGKPVRF
jgi:hypothetical protein